MNCTSTTGGCLPRWEHGLAESKGAGSGQPGLAPLQAPGCNCPTPRTPCRTPGWNTRSSSMPCGPPVPATPARGAPSHTEPIPLPQVTEDDIDEFQREYRGGAEERGDVLRYYERFQGDMDQVGGCRRSRASCLGRGAGGSEGLRCGDGQGCVVPRPLDRKVRGRAGGLALAGSAAGRTCRCCLLHWTCWGSRPLCPVPIGNVCAEGRPPLQVFEWVMCSSPDRDSHRFMDIIEAAVQAKEVGGDSWEGLWDRQCMPRRTLLVPSWGIGRRPVEQPGE